MKDINPQNAGRFSEEGLKMMTHCPVCHYQYNPMEAKVLDENDNAHLIHVKCRRCQSSVVALVMTNSFGISSIGLITDLDGLEIIRFRDMAKVEADDVIEAFEKVSLKGELERIFLA